MHFEDLMCVVGKPILNRMDGPTIAKLKMLSKGSHHIVCARNHRDIDNSYDYTERAIDAVIMNDLPRLQAIWGDLYPETKEDVFDVAVNRRSIQCILWMLSRVDHIKLYNLFEGLDGMEEKIMLAVIDSRRWTLKEIDTIAWMNFLVLHTVYPECVKKIARLGLDSNHICTFVLQAIEKDYPDECVRALVDNCAERLEDLPSYLPSYMYNATEELLVDRTSKVLRVMPEGVIVKTVEYVLDEGMFYVVCGRMFVGKYLSFELNTELSDKCRAVLQALEGMHAVDVVRVKNNLEVECMYPSGHIGVEFW